MNIFVLSENPIEAAQMLCNKHVPKMILESAQMLCSALVHHKKVPQSNVPYKSTHYNHPCTKWVAQSTANSSWLMHHALQMCTEFELRYNKIHKTQSVFIELYDKFPNEYNDSWQNHTPFALAMPDKYKCDDAVKSYRDFYKGEKYFAKWEPLTKTPDWWDTK